MVTMIEYFGINTAFLSMATNGIVACTAMNHPTENFSKCSLTAPHGRFAAADTAATANSLTGSFCGRSCCTAAVLASAALAATMAGGQISLSYSLNTSPAIGPSHLRSGHVGAGAALLLPLAILLVALLLLPGALGPLAGPPVPAGDLLLLLLLFTPFPPLKPLKGEGPAPGPLIPPLLLLKVLNAVAPPLPMLPKLPLTPCPAAELGLTGVFAAVPVAAAGG